jgi:hypothetical protein
MENTKFENTGQSDEYMKSFLKQFTSLLRVKSNINDLCEAKAVIKLPPIPNLSSNKKSKASVEIPSLLASSSQRRHSEPINNI